MDELRKLAGRLGVSLTEGQVILFEKYLEELMAWNERVNLTAIREAAEITLKHFVDSLTVISYIPQGAKRVIDIGSGAGFPGLPIAIARPDLAITLVESIGKKTAFLEHMTQVLGLSNVTVLNARAEDLAHEATHRESYDVAVARAVAFLPILAEYTLPFLKRGGIVIAQKMAPEEELRAADSAIKILGGALRKSEAVTLAELPQRSILVIEKVSPTPQEYPRMAGLPSKKPL